MISYNSNIAKEGLFVHVDVGNKKSYPGTGSTLYNLAAPLGYGSKCGNGTIVGAAQYQPEYGGSLYFSGVSGAPQYVNFGAATNINPIQEHTFEAWIKSKGLNTGQGTAGIWSYTYGLRLDIGASIGVNHHNKLTSLSYWLYALNFNPVTDMWFHVAFSSSGFQRRIYINGKLNNTDNNRWYGSNWPTSNIALGLDVNNTNTNNFYGNIAIGRAYKRVLSDDEVYQNFAAERGRFQV